MNKVLKIKNLKVCFETNKGMKKAVDGVSFDVEKGEIFGIVGESGCGKSVTSMSILKLVSSSGKIIDGEILVDGIDVLKLSENEIQSKIRGSKVSMIFQDPMTSLNPLLTIGEQISETLRIHKGLNKNEAKRESFELLKKVGIPNVEKSYESYPHSLSGGMRQRVMIAIAISCNPEILIADEPTTALDVTIQRQILNLMKEIRDNTGTSIVLITHDLGVIANMCDRVAVMYCGKIVELGKTEEILKNPMHPYTKGLIASIPDINQRKDELYNIKGTVPQIYEDTEGCYFLNRCETCSKQCNLKTPKLIEITNNHYVACHEVGVNNEE